ncbi:MULTISPECIES: type IV pilin-like G/H family protein [Spirulina sp. CCY15215]|uniref:type IV pilin-like G/H family protein n=1 Tax=Spirulina sp. CCY15215 TaxID=2767591 RepID=UPI0019507937|nr:type IV pilin-like G/H family protein [Spirulina major]
MNLKPEFQTKFLQYLNKHKQDDEGFTLIELLVVIIIIGILAAIALPSLLSQANKGKQAEARQNVGAVVRAEQAFMLEKGFLTTSMISLGLGLQTATVNYTYILKGAGGTDPQFNAIAANGSPNARALKAYVGIVGAAEITQNGVTEAAAIGFVCESQGIATDNKPSGTGDVASQIAPPAVAPAAFADQACNADAADGNNGKTAITAPGGNYKSWKSLGR